MPEKEKKIEQLSPGLTYEELDAHFHKYVFTDVTRQTEMAKTGWPMKPRNTCVNSTFCQTVPCFRLTW